MVMRFEPCGMLKKVIDDADDENEGCAVRIPMFDWFGYFRRERGLRPRLRYHRGGRIYYVDRFNPWRQSRTMMAHRCHLERQLEPIVYHLSENFPPELVESATMAATGGMRHFRKRFALFEMMERITLFPSLQIHSR